MLRKPHGNGMADAAVRPGTGHNRHLPTQVEKARRHYTTPHSNFDRMFGPDAVTCTIFSARAPKSPSGPW